jgi:citrate synthase
LAPTTGQKTTAPGGTGLRTTAAGGGAAVGGGGPGQGTTAGAELAAAEALLAAAAERGLPAPNVDFALAVLVKAQGLRAGSSATIFTVARIAGIVAHALEEYEHRLRFRPRASYVGPAAP